MLINDILVLGSKPESKLPDIKVEKIYSANGAAERATDYKKRYLNIHHTALIGSKEFSENENVKSRVVNSSPQFSNKPFAYPFPVSPF